MALVLSMMTIKSCFQAESKNALAFICDYRDVSYGARLQTALELAKTDRASLAKAMGVSVQSIGQTINGDTKAHTAENCAKAANALGVDLYWLATGDGEPRPAKATEWPFSFPLSRFLALTEKQQGIVEGRLLSAIEECERPSEEARAKELMQPATGRKPLTKRRAA